MPALSVPASMHSANAAAESLLQAYQLLPPPAVLHQLLSPAGGKCAVEMHVVHKVARFLCCLTLDMSGFMSGTSSVHLVSVWQVPAAVSCTPGKCGDGSTVC